MEEIFLSKNFVDNTYQQRDKHSNESFVEECKKHYLFNIEIPDINFSY
jgi:hypothetical protein